MRKKEVCYWKIGFFILLVFVVLYVVTYSGREVRFSALEDGVALSPDTSQGWHSWSQIQKPTISSDCAGANKAIKTLNLETGAVTCEVDDVGSSPTTSLPWSSITGKPSSVTSLEPYYPIDVGGKIMFFSNSFLRQESISMAVANAPLSMTLFVRTFNGVFQARVVSSATCGNSDSGWQNAPFSHSYRFGNWNCHRPPVTTATISVNHDSYGSFSFISPHVSKTIAVG